LRSSVCLIGQFLDGCTDMERHSDCILSDRNFCPLQI